MDWPRAGHPPSSPQPPPPFLPPPPPSAASNACPALPDSAPVPLSRRLRRLPRRLHARPLLSPSPWSCGCSDQSPSMRHRSMPAFSPPQTHPTASGTIFSPPFSLVHLLLQFNHKIRLLLLPVVGLVVQSLIFGGMGLHEPAMSEAIVQ